MTILGTVLGVVFMSYNSQLKSYYYQKQISEMQQNLRAALFLMTNEIKKAGLDSSRDADSDLITVNSDSISFTMDFTGGFGDNIDNNNDGNIDEGADGSDNNGNLFVDEPDEFEWFDGKTDGPGENITYRLSNDTDNDGINDALQDINNLECGLERTDHNTGNTAMVAYNIDALNFTYLNNARDIESVISKIRTVQISIIGRTNTGDSHMMKNKAVNQAFSNSAGTVILANQNDDIHRLIISTEVYCRNMGM